MSAEKECIGHARDFLKLARMTNNEELRDQLVQWPPSGWSKPCMQGQSKVRRLKEPSYKILERRGASMPACIAASYRAAADAAVDDVRFPTHCGGRRSNIRPSPRWANTGLFAVQ
jgi:hypothetical protein